MSKMAMSERRDRLYAEPGVPPEQPEDAWRRMRAEREEPEPRERKLDIMPPTLAEIDQRIGERIAAENEFMIALMAENNVELKREWVVGAMGPPGPSGPPGEQGPPGKLPLVKLWVPETVYYEGDVVAYDGGTFQAKRDTGQAPSHADWICLATAGRDGNSITVRGTFDETVDYRVSTSSLSTAEVSSRSRMHRVPARVPAGNCWRAKASAGSLARGESAATVDRRAIQD